MASAITSTVLVSTIVVIGAAALGSYYYVQERPPQVTVVPTAITTPSPSEISSASPTASPASTPSFVPLTQSADVSARVQGTTTWQTTSTPTPPKPTPSKSPSPTPSPQAAAQADYTIEFVDLPTQIDAGQSFVIKWRILGPAGARGSNSAVKVSYLKDSSNSHVSTNTSTSLGSFTVGQIMSTKFSLGSEPGTMNLTATAEIAGHNLSTTRQIELTD